MTHKRLKKLTAYSWGTLGALPFLTFFILTAFLGGPSFADNEQERLLRLYVQEGNMEKTLELLSEGVNPNAADENGATPLICVLSVPQFTESHAVIAEILIVEAGVDVNAKLISGDHQGATPLFYAVGQSRYDLVSLLLEHGADISSTDHKHITPLLVATARQDKEMQNFLIERGALTAAVRSGDLVVIRNFVENGIDINSIDGEEKSPLLRAAEFGQFMMFHELLRLGARTDTCMTENGWTLLHAAAMGGNPRIVHYVLDHEYRERVDMRSDGNRTPLMVAAFYGKSEAVRVLLENHAKIENKDSRGETALFYAVRFFQEGMNDETSPSLKTTDLVSDKMKVIRLLLDNKADAQSINQGGKSILYFVDSVEFGEKTAGLVETLIRHGANVNARTPDGALTPLIWSVYSEDIPLARALLTMGAALTLRDNNGRTALMIAEEQGKEQLISLLKKKEE